MSWQQVKKKEKRRDGRRHFNTNDIQSEQEIKELPATFKTQKCNIEEHHDHRPCPYYHYPNKDQRRNPFDEYYTVDECQNALERMYHPQLFRTTMCKFVKTPPCPFGRTCAHSHSTSELRDRDIATRQYENLPVSTVPRPCIDWFLPTAHQTQEYDTDCRALWSELHLKPASRFMPLEAHEYFIVDRSDALFNAMKQYAFEEGCGTVSRQLCKDGRRGLLIKGLHLDDIQLRVMSILTSPSQYFVLEKKSLGERVVESLKNTDEWAGALTRSNNVLVQFVGDSEIQVTAVNSKNEKAAESVKSVFEKIQFWIDREGYGTFKDCGCCGEKRNEDQGVACINGHFYCSIGDEDECCFAAAVTSQIGQLRTRDDGLVCPDCEVPYDVQKIATHLPATVWESVQKAIVDRKVEQQTEILQNQFDMRLQEKVREVMAKYDDADDLLRVEAQEAARHVRNSILNLTCPHCKIAYAEFSGCMALQCQSCKGHFCGYCHFAAASGMGAHDHVRHCLMNETGSASYYASPEQIAKAQKKYRTRELKKHLQQFKKDKQNAIVIELRQDLQDLGIKQEALFEVGNLQG